MQEKTEKPSQRKLKKARERGEVAHSAELTSTLVLAGGLLLLWSFSTLFHERLRGVFIRIFTRLNTLEPEEAMKEAGGMIVFPLAAILGGLFVLALLAHWVQTGWVWSRKKGKRKAKSRPFFTLLKVTVIGAIGYLTLKTECPSLNPPPLIETLFSLLVKVSLALLVLGIGDFIYQKWKYSQNMRMTRQELKDEQREAEGDSQSKSKMRKQ